MGKKILWAFITSKILEVFSELPGAPDGNAGGGQLGRSSLTQPGSSQQGEGRSMAGHRGAAGSGVCCGQRSEEGLQKWISSAAARAGRQQLVCCAAGSNPGSCHLVCWPVCSLPRAGGWDAAAGLGCSLTGCTDLQNTC